MSGPYRIVGYAIVSGDGMLADASGAMPDSLKYAADQRYFQSGLDKADAVIQGRHSHEGGPRADARRRLILTRGVAGFARDPVTPNAMLWNPAGASLEEALDAFGVATGTLGIIGGTDVFGLFLNTSEHDVVRKPLHTFRHHALEHGYDEFHLSRAPRDLRLPGGRPVFPQVLLGQSPEEILTQSGLKAGPVRTLDENAGVTVQVFQR